MLDITKCFSILIASGNGSRCNQLKFILNSELLEIDKITGKHKIVIMKHGQKTMPDDFERVSKYFAKQITPLFKDIDDYYFSIDLPKKRLSK